MVTVVTVVDFAWCPFTVEVLNSALQRPRRETSNTVAVNEGMLKLAAGKKKKKKKNQMSDWEDKRGKVMARKWHQFALMLSD